LFLGTGSLTGSRESELISGSKNYATGSTTGSTTGYEMGSKTGYEMGSEMG